MKLHPVLLAGLLLVTVAFASTPSGNCRYLPVSTPTSNSIDGAPVATVDSRGEYTVDFTVRIPGVTVTTSEAGASVRLGGVNSQPVSGMPDVGGYTVFLPFNSAVTATATASLAGIHHYTVDQLGARVATFVDPDQPNSSLDEVPQPATVVVGEPGVMRDFGVVPITVYPIRKTTDGGIEVAEEVIVRVNARQTGAMLTAPLLVSWDGMYRAMFLGYDDFSIGRSKLHRPGTYLIIKTSNPASSQGITLNNFVTSKKLEGYNVIVQTGGEGAPTYVTNSQIRDYIQAVYDTVAIPLEYVVLIGDENRATNYKIPAWNFNAPGQVGEVVYSDMQYTFLRGNDFWPEICIGRMSGFDLTTYAQYMRRAMKWQNDPDRGSSMSRYFGFAGNFSDTGTPPITPTWNTRWALEFARYYGFTTDSVFYPPTYPGTPEIVAALNEGNELVTYRGWGDSQGPLYPRFRLADIASINSTSLPIWLNIVCQNGAFAGANILNGVCFGEGIMEAGTVTAPRGASAFVGAAHLHTSTRFNNPILAGYMTGWLAEKIDKLGLNMLRAKLDLYRNFPLEPIQVEAYFKYYNILGDPSTQLWMKHPDSLIVNFPTSISASNSLVQVSVRNGVSNQPLPEMVVATISPNGTNQNVITTDANGIGTIPVRANAGDSIYIAVRGFNFRPIKLGYVVAGATASMRVDSVRMNDGGNRRVDPGESGSVSIFVTNLGAAAQSTSSILSSLNNERIQVTQNSANAGMLNPGASAELTFNIDAFAYWDDNPAPMRLTFGSTPVDFMMPMGWVFPNVESVSITSGNPSPGGTATIVAVVSNHGTATIPASTVEATTFANGCNVITAPVQTPPIAHGENYNFQFQITVPSNQIAGHVIPFRLAFRNSRQLVYAAPDFAVALGSRPVNQPVGPDRFGYYAYEDVDQSSYVARPTYTWRELDPDSAGGPTGATMVWMADDSTITIPLPFNFKYYETTYQQGSPLSICSNGWVAFGNTWQTDFYNWRMPNPQGPRAMIAANWDDIKGIPANNDSLQVYYLYDSVQRKFYIQWSKGYSRYGIESNPIPQRFQLVLNQDPYAVGSVNEFMVNYRIGSDVDANNNFCTIGMMNWERNDGLTVTYARHPAPGADTLRSGRSIKFTTYAPDNFSGVEEGVHENLPANYLLSNVFPNPFNSTVSFRFSMPRSERVNVSIYNLKGELVTQIADRDFSAGTHQFSWQANDIAGGVYFLKVNAGSYHAARKLIYLK